jgi:putative FmdB family regulatory protein
MLWNAVCDGSARTISIFISFMDSMHSRPLRKRLACWMTSCEPGKSATTRKTMPQYDYECPLCGVFAEFRSIAERSSPGTCPSSGRASKRLVSAPNLNVMPAANRRKWATNERSQYEPRVGSKHVCSSGCGCGSNKPAIKSGHSKYQTGRAGSRPWMLGD